MTANYYRMSLRFKNEGTKKRLKTLRRELERETNKKVSESHLVETIVEQFLDKQGLTSLQEEKTSLEEEKE